MPEELVDIFDENYKYLGTAFKSEARKNGNWVQAFHCWIIRPENNGYLLFQKRGKDKKVFPNALDISAAGHYKSGETIEEGGFREIKEEIGIEVDFKDLIPLGVKFDIGVIGDLKIREFCHTFLYKNSKLPSEYTLAKDEVEGLVEISIEDGLSLFSNKKKTVKAIGVELNKKTGKYENIELIVDKNLFIPRIDQYYYKIFILAKRLLNNENHFAI